MGCPRGISFSRRLFSGAMLVSGRVINNRTWQNSTNRGAKRGFAELTHPPRYSKKVDLKANSCHVFFGITKNQYLVGVFNTFEKFSQIGSFPQAGVKIKNIWNHHLDTQHGSMKDNRIFTYISVWLMGRWDQFIGKNIQKLPWILSWEKSGPKSLKIKALGWSQYHGENGGNPWHGGPPSCWTSHGSPLKEIYGSGSSKWRHFWGIRILILFWDGYVHVSPCIRVQCYIKSER